MSVTISVSKLICVRDPVDSSLPIFPNLKRNAIATGSVDGTGSATARHKAQHTTSGACNRLVYLFPIRQCRLL